VTADVPDITIGIVAAPFGVRGEVKVKMETDFPERYEDLKDVWLQPRVGSGRTVGIKSVRFHKGAALLKFDGYDDRTSVEELRGAELRIDESQLAELEPGQFYIHDLMGLDVYTTEGAHLGQITEVLQGPGNDVYVTAKALIPALKQVVKEVDLAARKMIIEPMEGMLGE
jgi:16S rRNA processing protein RimM